MPPTARFKSKPRIALEQIKQMLGAGVAKGVLLMDADYGRDSKLRRGGRGFGAVVRRSYPVESRCCGGLAPVSNLAAGHPRHAAPMPT